MKLRNKRTGDIWEFDGGFLMKASRETTDRAGGRGCSLTCCARSLAELNADWEDVEPAEPLIKDEKIRKAVRLWAECEDSNTISVEGTYGGRSLIIRAQNGMAFWTSKKDSFSKLEVGGNYTIAELCGEGEERPSSQR